MASYRPEINIQDSIISITLHTNTGAELESVIVSQRRGKPKRQHAIVVEFRVVPESEAEAHPLLAQVPWREGDPLQVDVLVTEVLTCVKPRTFGLKHTKRQGLALETKGTSANHSKPQHKTRGLTPIGEGKTKKSLRTQKPIIIDD